MQYMTTKRRSIRRLWLRWIGTAAGFLVLLAAGMYVYEMPGGIADFRYSRAAGMSATIHIPIGRTPQEAVEKFRSTDKIVVHQEPIAGGMLLFLKRYDQAEGSTNLQVEYVRKTWLGWKWAMGGGYGISSRMNADEALNYMTLSRAKGVKGPFPMIFGEITHSDIANVKVSTSGIHSATYEAKLIEIGFEQRLWYVTLPAADIPYEIEALSGNGTIVARQTVKDANDVAVVRMK